MWQPHPLVTGPLIYEIYAAIYGEYIAANLGCSCTNDDNVLLHTAVAEAVFEKCANYKCHLNAIQT